MMLASAVCRCSGWAGRDHSAWKEVTPHSTIPFPWGCSLAVYGERSHSKSPFLGRTSGEPTIPPGKIRPTGVGPQDNLSAQPPTKAGVLETRLAITEPPRLMPDYIHEPHKAPI